MNLPEDLIKEFGALLGSTEKTRTDKNVYGTVTRKSSSAMYVQLDGSDLETPVAYTTDAEVGDRVLVMIKDHKATITGNVSSPVNARANDKFLKFSSEGLRIGILDSNGNPTGYSILIDGSTYYIKDVNNVTVAKLAASEVSLLSGQGIMKVIDGILYLMGQKAAGFRSAHSGTNYRAEVVTKCDPEASDWGSDTNPAASIQVIHPDSSVANHAFLVNHKGVFADDVPVGRVYEQQYVLTPKTTIVTIQTYKIVATLDAPPAGYRWEGISGVLIDLGKYVETAPSVGHTEWNNNYFHDDNRYITINHATLKPDTRQVYVSFSSNAGSYQYIKLVLLCFALPFSNVTTGSTKYIEFDTTYN